jgi:hypothetical protein
MLYVDKELELQETVLNSLADFMIDKETDPCKKTKIMVIKQCGLLSKKFRDLAFTYGDTFDEKITENDSKKVLEYLKIIESGVDVFLESTRGDSVE